MNSLVHRIDLEPEEIDFYRHEGYLQVPGLLAADQLPRLREEMFTVLEANGVSRQALVRATSTNDKLRETTQYLAGGYIDAVANSAHIRHLAEQLLGGPATLYMPFTAAKAGGGGGEFHFHQDNNYTRHEPGSGSLNIWIAAVDMTPANGCLCIVPRSQQQGQWEAVPSPDGDNHRTVANRPEHFLHVRMRAGDAIVFSRLTVHCSVPNTTAEPRLAYALQFHRNDTQFYDPETNELKLLLDHPRWHTGPVAKLGKTPQ